jgi:hypothetical protein
MNRIFRLALSRAVGQWVPVSEQTCGAAKGRRQLCCSATRRRIAARALLTASLDPMGLVQAAPGGALGTNSGGQQSNQLMTDQASRLRESRGVASSLF